MRIAKVGAFSAVATIYVSSALAEINCASYIEQHPVHQICPSEQTASHWDLPPWQLNVDSVAAQQTDTNWHYNYCVKDQLFDAHEFAVVWPAIPLDMFTQCGYLGVSFSASRSPSQWQRTTILIGSSLKEISPTYVFPRTNSNETSNGNIQEKPTYEKIHDGFQTLITEVFAGVRMTSKSGEDITVPIHVTITSDVLLIPDWHNPTIVARGTALGAGNTPYELHGYYNDYESYVHGSSMSGDYTVGQTHNSAFSVIPKERLDGTVNPRSYLGKTILSEDGIEMGKVADFAIEQDNIRNIIVVSDAETGGLGSAFAIDVEKVKFFQDDSVNFVKTDIQWWDKNFRVATQASNGRWQIGMAEESQVEAKEWWTMYGMGGFSVEYVISITDRLAENREPVYLTFGSGIVKSIKLKGEPIALSTEPTILRVMSEYMPEEMISSVAFLNSSGKKRGEAPVTLYVPVE